ncbi:hypothetical protein ACIRU8_41040 [Streptomyces sp. NPDC101175]|uniref:hypothetical protein n=1 Tax=Streptomyces sp. NPDC101175 TaxID=3366123 RepID=UPI0038337005
MTTDADILAAPALAERQVLPGQVEFVGAGETVPEDPVGVRSVVGGAAESTGGTAS